MLIFISSNVNSSRKEALLYIFKRQRSSDQDDFQGKKPTMRHVSRTHRVAIDRLFDRIHLDPKIQIKYIDTKNQLADILTKKEISHVTSGIICCVCSISAMSVLQFALKQWPKDFNQIQEKNESQQNRDP